MPAFNAERHLEGVAARIPRELWNDIAHLWIVNDGSNDGTAAVIEQLSHENPKVRPVHFSWNRGYGKAVREGLSRCKGDACDYAVCLHADGQYPPEAIPGFIGKMAANNIDIMQGSRIAPGTALSGGMPRYKYFAGKTLTFFENIVFGLSLTDYHSGMLCYGRKALETLPFDRLSAGFECDIELIALGRAAGLSIAEMPIPTRYADEVSYLRPVEYGMSVLGVMARYLAGRYKPR
ncbi:MAG TPA: glycosyltransferase family 2 protein [Chitinivibrionales bacterium]|nr:glycosyltransferase family 2 protein [Chitinivibrionales bacterium]